MRLAVLLALLVACGDQLPGATDAPPASDASNIGLVKVWYRGALNAGHEVVFQNADSSIVLVTRTDAQGRANAYMAPGGYATLVGIAANTHFIFTWSDVQPGDELVLDRRAVTKAYEPSSYLMSVPLDPEGVAYNLYTSCGSASLRPDDPSAVVVNLTGCGDATDMLVQATLPGTTALAHYFYVPDVPLATTGITLSGTYRPLDASQIVVQGVPAGIHGLTATQRLVQNGRSLYPQSSPLSSAVSNGQAGFGQAFPLPVEGTLMTSIDPVVDFSAVGASHLIRWEPATAVTSIDLGGIPLRKYTDRATYLAGTHAIHWGEDPYGVIAAAVLVQFGWANVETHQNYQWQLIAPRTAEPTIYLPHLPHPDLTPGALDTIIHPTTLANLEVDGGYEQIRRDLLGRWMPGTDQVWPATGASGTVRYVDLTPQF